MQEIDARINQNVLLAKEGLLTYYDPIVQEITELEQLQVELSQPPSFINAQGQQELNQLLQVQKDLTNQQWQRLQPLLPKPSPKGGRPANDHRTIINGILWIRRVLPGETYLTVMEPGRLSQDASMLGASEDSGNRF